MSTVELLNQIKKLAGKFRKVTGIDVYETLSARFADFAGQTLAAGEWFTVLNRTGRGCVEEFQVRSPSTSFKIALTIDGESALEKTYDELRLIQQNSPSISAFAERDEEGDLTGYYVVSVRNIPYYNSILLKVQNTGATPITFNQLFVKHNLSGE